MGREGDLSAANCRVRRNITSHLARINNKYGKVDGFFAQETNNYSAKLPPLLNFKPTETDEHVTFGRGQNGIRGVANWVKKNQKCKEDDDRILSQLPKDQRNEIAVSILRYANKKRKTIPVAILNTYRNIHKQFERSENDTKKAVQKICEKLRQLGVRNYVLVGDFNSSTIKFNQMTKIHNSELFHKANKNSAKTYIDGVFTNMINVGFLEVGPTLENIQESTDTENNLLGHKSYTLWIGGKPTKEPVQTMKVAKQEKIGKIAKMTKTNLPDLKLLENSEWDEFCDVQQIDILGEQLVNCMAKIKEKATATIRITAKERKEQIIFENVETSADFQHKTSKPWRSLYGFISNIKEDGEEDVLDSEKPSLERLTTSLEEKFKELRKEEPEIVEKYLNKQFPPNFNKKGTFHLTKSKFSSLIMSTSNSGAKDIYGLSLKDVKTIIRKNSEIRDLFHALTQRCLKTGTFPEAWRKDLIFYIWKRKGEKSEPKSYRPITIGCSIGKMFEKVLADYISNVHDNNEQNHAYVRKKNCLSAITEVQKKLLRIQTERDRSLGAPQYHHIPILSADDISNAFQSVSHDAICNALKNEYLGDTNYNISSTLRSFLQRDTWAIDRKTGQKIRVNRKFLDRSIPQGSILSPALWRMFDGLFSGYYNDLLDKLASKETNYIKEAEDTSFADDHFSLNWLRIPKIIEGKIATDAQIGLIIRSSVKATRSLLVIATEKFGCGCNPDKSENIVQPKYLKCSESEEFETKSTIKWLGYKLKLLDNGQLVFDVEYAKSKFITATNLLKSVFQYTKNMRIRVKVYKTYMAPFTEWFIPLVLQEKAHKEDTIVHKFQNECLKMTLDLPFTASTQRTEEILNERSIKLKAARAAKRINLICETIKAEEEAVSIIEGANAVGRMETRRNKNQAVGVNTGSNAFRTSYICRMNAYLKIEDSHVKTKLDFEKITKETRKLRKLIGSRIKRRKLNSQQ